MIAFLYPIGYPDWFGLSVNPIVGARLHKQVT
jgi:hypothetical protein